MLRPTLVGWISLICASWLFAQDVTIHIDANQTLHTINPAFTGLCLEDVNHEIYGGLYSQMIFGESFAEPADEHGISRMWSAVARGDAKLVAEIEPHGRLPNQPCQRVGFTDGSGEVGIANRGLNHQGMVFQTGKPYEGYVCLRGSAGQSFAVSLESTDGRTSFARQTLRINSDSWQKYDFALTPQSDRSTSLGGQFAIRLLEPGSIKIDYAFLQPGSWGRFHDLPVRRDVAEALLSTGVRFIRYGGSMVNEPEYRLKNMYGPRENRPAYKGHWYAHSSNGWSVIDFLNFCEAAGVEAVPDFSIDESPTDLFNFVQYANGPAESPWGTRRIADGHPKPYNLRHIELGNEEKVDGDYLAKFRFAASNIWNFDRNIVVIVGDFAYRDQITNPFELTGADSEIKTLDTHAQILQMARRADAQVWFDVHVWTEDLQPSPSAYALSSYIDAIDGLANDAKHRVVVFELNANKHDLTRALSNADVMLDLLRDGRLPMVSSANALQVDGQNDSGWDQGLVFLNPSKTWLQPPGYAMQIFGVANGAALLNCDVQNGDGLNIVALQSGDKAKVSLLILNTSDRARQAKIQIDDFSPRVPQATVTTLAGDLRAINDADHLERLVPRTSKAAVTNGALSVEVDAHGLMRIDAE